MNPKVSILLPVFNAEAYLKEALDSLLSQTYADYELLIINDGSSDSSDNIIKSVIDQRIIYKKFDSNQGLIHVLNYGLSIAKGDYILRMDADDIAAPNRIEKQLFFMEQNPNVGVCGTQLNLIGANDNVDRPCNDEDLRWWFFKSTPFAHPSVIIRNNVLKNYHLQFDINAYVAEDFDLWWKIAFHSNLANLPEKLLWYRVHPLQESSKKTQIQQLNHRKSLIQFMSEIGLNSDAFDPDFISNALYRNLDFSPQNLVKSWKLFQSLKSSPKAIEFFSLDALNRKCSEVIDYQLKNMNSFNWSTLTMSFQPDFSSHLSQAGVNKLTWITKSILFWKTR
ncbi:MAG: glycosyltransferase family 2 protein [Bacteroidia bacterium]|nr:glycosyltransferase family 2 protein [Bacteroidia bacterium]